MRIFDKNTFVPALAAGFTALMLNAASAQESASLAESINNTFAKVTGLYMVEGGKIVTVDGNSGVTLTSAAFASGISWFSKSFSAYSLSSERLRISAR